MGKNNWLLPTALIGGVVALFLVKMPRSTEALSPRPLAPPRDGGYEDTTPPGHTGLPPEEEYYPNPVLTPRPAPVPKPIPDSVVTPGDPASPYFGKGDWLLQPDGSYMWRGFDGSVKRDHRNPLLTPQQYDLLQEYLALWENPRTSDGGSRESTRYDELGRYFDSIGYFTQADISERSQRKFGVGSLNRIGAPAGDRYRFTAFGA